MIVARLKLLGSLGTCDILDIQVDIEADQTFVFDLGILCDHQDVLLLDQMLDGIRDLAGLFCCFFHSSAHLICSCEFCHNIINDLTLLRRLLTL